MSDAFTRDPMRDAAMLSCERSGSPYQTFPVRKSVSVPRWAACAFLACFIFVVLALIGMPTR